MEHNPHGGGTRHCDNARIESLIAQYQTNRDLASLSEIVKLIQPRALTLIRFRKTTLYVSEGELLSDINLKLLKAVGSFDRDKGSAFTFLSCLITNTLHTAVSNARRNASRHVEFDEAAASKLVTNGEIQSRDALDDLAHRIRVGVKTTVTDPREVGMQRWYVDSLIEGAFELRRSQCANAAMVVYNVSHERSRELYDLTILEVRRLMYDDLSPRALIAPGRLLGTRAQWMTRYAPLMNAHEFTKFVTLMKDLGPFVILLVDPQNRSRRQDRSAQVTRRPSSSSSTGTPTR